MQSGLQLVGLLKNQKRRFTMLDDVSGIIHPGRLCLLLGPPGTASRSDSARIQDMIPWYLAVLLSFVVCSPPLTTLGRFQYHLKIQAQLADVAVYLDAEQRQHSNVPWASASLDWALEILPLP